MYYLILLFILSLVAYFITDELLPKLEHLFIKAGLFGIDLCKSDKKKIPEATGVISGCVFLVISFLFIPIIFGNSLMDTHNFPHNEFAELLAALLSICCMLLLGFADDVLDLRWRYKLLLPTVASLPLLVVYYVNFNSTTFIVPIPLRQWLGISINIGFLYYIYMGMLAVFCTNAINILAGINGLEVGQSVIIALSIVVFDIIELRGDQYKAHTFSLQIMIPYLATTLALLKHNWTSSFSRFRQNLLKLPTRLPVFLPRIVTVSDGHPEFASLRDNWRVLLAHYAGPVAVLVVVALLVVVLPLAALFWCCCYWCRVGRRRRPFDRKYDACFKGLLAIVLIALLTLFLFGVVCAFATDSQVDSGAAEAPESLRAGLKDARTFLNATQAHARWLLVVNYKELADKLNSVLYTSGLTVSMKLGEFSRAVSVTTLNKMVLRLDDVQANLRAVHELTASLRTRAEELNAGLRKVKHQLLETLNRCNQPKCIALQDKYKIGQLNTEIHYSQMPDVTELLNNVTWLIDGHIKEEVAAGHQVFNDIQRGIRRSVDEHIPNVQEAIADTGRRLATLADRITDMAGNASATLAAEEENVQRVQDAADKYRPYRRYVGIAPAAVLLLITLLMVWGLTCGVCGKRPDVYGASDCCNKGAGSKCLLCGVCVTLVGGACVCAALGAYFALGLVAQRALCDPLTEPRDNRLFNDVDKFVDLEKVMFNEHSDPEFQLSSVLVSCHDNRTIYEALHLHRLYDLDQMEAEMWGEVSRRVASLRPVYPAAGAHVTILREPAKQKLTQLANTGLSDFDFDKILDALETNMTSLALEGLARQLNSTARSLSQPAFQVEARDLMRAAAALSTLATHTLHPMLRDAEQLNATAIRLRDELRFNHSSLKEAISYLMHETTEAEVFLNTQGPERLQNMTKSFAAVIAWELQRYMQRVSVAARQHVGRCGPLSNAFNATRDAACKKILMPTNGYWMSLAWCVLLFVPMMVVAQKLAKLYLHVDPYPGPLVEAEYLYDAYADRDNVPLANGSKRSTLDIEGKIAEWRGRAGGGGSGGGGGGGTGGDSEGSPSSPPCAGSSPPHSRTRLLLEGADVVCQLVAPPAALIDDLKTRLDAKDEDNESGIHESE